MAKASTSTTTGKRTTGKHKAAARAKTVKRPPAPVRSPFPPERSEVRETTAATASASSAPSTSGISAVRPAGDPRGKYVYCVISTGDPLTFGPIGIGIEPAEVHTINYRDIAAVVSDTPIELYEPTRQNVLAHERVNETVMCAHTVIPMSFGTVFKTRDDIAQLLTSAYDAFKDVLVKMEDKLEYGLKVLWDRDRIVEDLERENEGIRHLKAEISGQRGSTYFARMQYGRLVDAALQQRTECYVQEIFDELRPVAVASRANRPIGDKMILNAAFLVRRDKEPDFDAAVKAIGAKHEHMTFKYTGPWPPYNFVNIRLKLERA